MTDEKKPSIETAPNGPLMVKNLTEFRNSKGDTIEPKPMMALCRCGDSENKPYCDGKHVQAGFTGEKQPERTPDVWKEYKGKDVTISDNRGVCSHAAYCTDESKKIWRYKQEPWIVPDADTPEEAIRIVKKCPSGALKLTWKGKEVKDFPERSPKITIMKDGPYAVEGGPEFKDSQTNSEPESKEHYALCRCGGSKNKPFCDGQHWYKKFKDEKN